MLNFGVGFRPVRMSGPLFGQQTPLARVEGFLGRLNPEISKRELRSRISFELIGPTFLPIDQHKEYDAMKQVVESEETQYSAETRELARRCVEILDNYYGRDDDEGGFAGNW